MGNFSRDTFDPAKSYVAVRLQQGVPLVDADWNELQDITRNELYWSLSAAAMNVARRGGLDVSVTAGGNDIQISPGTAVIGGRPIRLATPLQYTTQRYASAATAAADGVPQVLPQPLTQPPGARSDAVYLEVLEREVVSAEDPNLINGAIGIETSTRLKREVVLRVGEGVTFPPPPPGGGGVLHVAQIERNAGPITQSQIVDAKPYAPPLGPRQVSFAPAFTPVSNYIGTGAAHWAIEVVSYPSRMWARKSPAVTLVVGFMPLTLPDGARLTEISLHGNIGGAGGSVGFHLARVPRDATIPSQPPVANASAVTASGPFNRVAAVPGTAPTVDNATYYYIVMVIGSGPPQIDIFGGTVRYVP